MFVGPYEHHSNELPWRESIADLRVIREDADGRLDLEHLREELELHADRPLKIGSFSAASNVTGIITDVDAVATLLHRHGALSFWDYAAAGPYVDIEMNPDDRRARTGTSPTRTRSSSRRTSSSAGPGRPASSSPSARCSTARVADGPRRRHGRVRHGRRSRLPRRGRASRGGGNARDRRVDPRRARLPAQERRRRRPDPRARGRPPSAGDRLLGANPEHRHPRQHRAAAAVDRLARPAPPARDAASALRRVGPQRPLRHPGARRLLLRRPVPAAPPRPRRRDGHGRWSARCSRATRGPSSAGSA